MSSQARNRIQAILKHYQDSQPNGIKIVERQLEIYSEESLFFIFPASGVIGSAEPIILEGKQDIRRLFEQYNAHAETFDSVNILYMHQIIDPEALKGSFVMHITMTKGGKSHQYCNSLQMHFNKDFEVILSINWQADITDSRVAGAL